jgi:hypothetical protein
VPLDGARQVDESQWIDRSELIDRCAIMGLTSPGFVKRGRAVAKYIDTGKIAWERARLARKAS